MKVDMSLKTKKPTEYISAGFCTYTNLMLVFVFYFFWGGEVVIVLFLHVWGVCFGGVGLFICSFVHEKNQIVFQVHAGNWPV